MSDPFKDALRKAGECLSPTPETDVARAEQSRVSGGQDTYLVHYRVSERIERQRNKVREQLASEKVTRNAIIAKGIETERQLAEARQAFAIATSQLVQAQGELRQAREENARLREALANATCLLLAVGQPEEPANSQRSWYDARNIVLEQVNKLTP